jgi:UDP-3-O-[3-hydroxymyristoyl] glucosamine N-acyltransferase
MPYTIADIAKLLGGEVLGEASLVLKGFAPADRAQPGDLTFAENENYFARAEQSAASAIIIDGPGTASRKTLIRVPNARVAFAKVLPLFYPEQAFAAGIHPTAIVPASARIDPTAHVGPYCILGEKVRIGPRSVLQGLIHVGADCLVGEDVTIFPNVTLYPRTEVGNRVRIHSGTVVGSDGFGYVLDNGIHRKVPQIGNVIICDDVELGANVTVDRGALGPTIIGKGTKIDNLVQIAHNVTIGEHCIIVSQTGWPGRPLEDRQPRLGRGPVRRDAQHPRRRDLDLDPGATRPPSQAADDRFAAVARAVPPRQSAGETARAQGGTARSTDTGTPRIGAAA